MPRCKNCKIKFEATNFNQKFCLDDLCVKACVSWTIEQRKKNEEKKWRKEKTRRKNNMKTNSELMSDAQDSFNAFIRERDKGLGCISCKKPFGQMKYDAGHYFSRNGHKNITYHENNVHGQCVHCNQHLHGNHIEYQINLVEKIGMEEMMKLYEIAYEIRRYDNDELRGIISLYKKKLKELKKSRS